MGAKHQGPQAVTEARSALLAIGRLYRHAPGGAMWGKVAVVIAPSERQVPHGVKDPLQAHH